MDKTSPINWAVILSMLGVMIAFISLFWNILSKSGERVRTAMKEVAHLQERCSLLEMKMGIFWRLVEENLSGMLKKPTHHEMDVLLDKLKAHTLTLDECFQLKSWLQKVYLADSLPPAVQDRILAILVLAAVESLIHELESKQS